MHLRKQVHFLAHRDDHRPAVAFGLGGRQMIDDVLGRHLLDLLIPMPGQDVIVVGLVVVPGPLGYLLPVLPFPGFRQFPECDGLLLLRELGLLEPAVELFRVLVVDIMPPCAVRVGALIPAILTQRKHGGIVDFFSHNPLPPDVSSPDTVTPKSCLSSQRRTGERQRLWCGNRC